jgi:hypothetical protein
MITIPYRVGPSRIPGAGLGIHTTGPVEAGRVITAPVAIERTWRPCEIAARPDAQAILPAAVRWFEDQCTVGLEWPDECYLNHAFDPTGIWHLGFVFAARDLAADTEITIDYRHLLPEGETEAFVDAPTGRPIIGLPWRESLALSLSQLARAQGADTP